MGTWYEAPADMMTSMSTATTDAKTTASSLLQVLKTAGIDINTWITGLKIVGEDDLDGTKAYHLSGAIDISKVVADAMKMSQDKTLQSAIPGMDALGSTGTSLALPTGTDMAELQKQLGSMFQNFTVDVWVTKDDYQVRKVAVNAKIVPPAGEDAQGIKDITLAMNFSMAPSDAAGDRHPAGQRPAVQRAGERPWVTLWDVLRDARRLYRDHHPVGHVAARRQRAAAPRGQRSEAQKARSLQTGPSSLQCLSGSPSVFEREPVRPAPVRRAWR